MDENKFDEPRIALNRIYTKTGDEGHTSLSGGRRVPKDSLRIECYGTVDELNAFVGMALLSAQQSLPLLQAILGRIQHELFNLGAILATPPDQVHARQPRITAVEVDQLEHEMDQMNASLPPLRSFVLPGGSRISTELHVCRTVCRRAERVAVRLAREETVPAEAVRYLNRLSDAFSCLAAGQTIGSTPRKSSGTPISPHRAVVNGASLQRQKPRLHLRPDLLVA